MDDLLREFLTETSESLDTVDNQLVRFEQEPNNAKILDNIFRLVHTIKGTCGFLGLPRLEALAHAAETLMGKFRDGMPVTGAGGDADPDHDRPHQGHPRPAGGHRGRAGRHRSGPDRRAGGDGGAWHGGDVDGGCTGRGAPPTPAAPATPAVTQGTLVPQTLERPLRPGEVSLDELERAFRETAIEAAPVPAKAAARQPQPHGAPEATAAGPTEAKPAAAAKPAASKPRPPPTKCTEADKVANQSIRVNVDTLEHLMTMVSELVLTRNQLLEISRRNEDTEFKVPLQRLSNVTAELQEGVMKTRMQPIGNAWQKLPRIVRDLSGELGKQIELEMHGADTELDRQVLDLIKDPLTHMVRNSADHGLETPAERAASGKPEQGTIRLSAYHEGGHIIICIADNGRGLNTERIKAKA